MPTKMVATVTVVSFGGNTTAESSHPSFESAWTQVHREMEKQWQLVKPMMGKGLAESDDHWIDGFDTAMQDARLALPEPGAVELVYNGSPIFTYHVTSYEPLSSIEPTEYFTAHQAKPGRFLSQVTA